MTASGGTLAVMREPPEPMRAKHATGQGPPCPQFFGTLRAAGRFDEDGGVRRTTDQGAQRMRTPFERLKFVVLQKLEGSRYQAW